LLRPAQDNRVDEIVAVIEVMPVPGLGEGGEDGGRIEAGPVGLDDLMGPAVKAELGSAREKSASSSV
jgi:hypothetical protein